MKNKFIYALALAAFVLTSCDETTDTIGSSLTDFQDHLKITTDTFLVSSRSIVIDSVLSKGNRGYLGRIKDPETGAIIEGNFMAQFNVLEDFHFPEDSKIVSKDENGIYADSCRLILYYKDFYGDSLATMKVTAYEMSKPMEEGEMYYSNFDPIEEGFVDNNSFKVSKMYSIVDKNQSSISYPNITFPLNHEYTDKNGKTYRNYGTYIMQKYKENPDNFLGSYNFIHNVCPGFYFKVENGIGSMADIYLAQLSLFFKMDNDSIYEANTVFAGTEEVIQKTSITNDKNTMKSLAEDNTCTYLRTPAGIFTELTLPVEEILKGHDNDTLNTASIVLTKIRNDVESEYSLDNAERLLLIQKDSLFTFFEQGKINDNKKTFLSSSQLKSGGKDVSNIYVFNNISSLITFMDKLRTEGEKSDSNWLQKHPDWNKAVLVPVNVTLSSNNSYSATVTAVNNEMKLTSTKLVGGSANPNTPIKIGVVYSKFSDK